MDSFQIGFTKKNLILLSDVALILSKTDLRKGKQGRLIQLTLSSDTYSINNFNAKDKVAVLH